MAADSIQEPVNVYCYYVLGKVVDYDLRSLKLEGRLHILFFLLTIVNLRL